MPSTPHLPATTVRRLLLPAALAVVLFTGCATGPTTKAELCAGLTELSEQTLRGNAGVGNPLFDAAGDLAGIAERYTSGGLADDAAALQAIADSDSTDTNELRNASMSIAAECDAPPVGLGF